MDRLAAMQIFLAVAERSSFTQAAESLGIPKAATSQAIQQLEDQLSTRLLHRTTRRVELTQDGRVYYERCKELLADMDELNSLFQQTPATLSGRLRVDMPTGAAMNVVIPHLSEFMDRYPHIEVELSCTDRQVDLVAEGFDCVVRVGHTDDSSLIARHIGTLDIITCASPAYIERYGSPQELDALGSHQLVHYTTVLGSQPFGWEYWDGKHYQTFPVSGSLTVNNVQAYTAACVAGLGMVQVPRVGVAQLLSEGRLVQVMSAYEAEPMPIMILYPHRRNLSKRVHAFVDWLSELLAGYAQGV